MDKNLALYLYLGICFGIPVAIHIYTRSRREKAIYLAADQLGLFLRYYPDEYAWLGHRHALLEADNLPAKDKELLATNKPVYVLSGKISGYDILVYSAHERGGTEIVCRTKFNTPFGFHISRDSFTADFHQSMTTVKYSNKTFKTLKSSDHELALKLIEDIDSLVNGAIRRGFKITLLNGTLRAGHGGNPTGPGLKDRILEFVSLCRYLTAYFSGANGREQNGT